METTQKKQVASKVITFQNHKRLTFESGIDDGCQIEVLDGVKLERGDA